MHATLRKYIETKLIVAETGGAKAGANGGDAAVDVSDAASAAAAAGGSTASVSAEDAAEVAGALRRVGMPSSAAAKAAAALCADGYDSVPALKAGALNAASLGGYGMSDAEASSLLTSLSTGGQSDAVRAWMVGEGISSDAAQTCSTALAADGFDSVDALRAGAQSPRISPRISPHISPRISPCLARFNDLR